MANSLSPVALAQLVEFTEAQAAAALARATPPEFGVELEESEAHVALVAPTLDVLLFNRVIGLGLRHPATRRVAGEIVGRYRAAGTVKFGVQLSPEARPRELSGWLGGLGLEVRDCWTKMYRPAGAVPAMRTELRIERIPPASAALFGEVACGGFGMPETLRPLLAGSVGRPGWCHYLAWDGGIPVAVAALLVTDRVGWLGVAATLPTHRRRGAQGALMAARLRDGMDLGCRWFVTETGQERPDRPNPSFHNMLRAGFLVAYDRPNYMLPRPTAT